MYYLLERGLAVSVGIRFYCLSFISMSITEDTEELVRGAKERLLGNRDSHQRKIRTGEMVQH